MPRLVQAIALFLAGAAFSWWVSHPATVVVTTSAPETTAPEAPDRAAVATFTDHVDEPSAELPPGIPPLFATVPKSHPSAGRKRALARALAELDRLPTEPAAAIDPELEAEVASQLAVKIREHFISQGD